jgi:hypothetical protein
VRQGDAVSSLAAAQQALSVDANRYEAYYYSAYALYQQDSLADAGRYASEALRRASDQGTRDQIQTLINAIQRKPVFLAKIRQADAEVTQGVLARAADDYAAAWTGFKSRADIGVKAAELYLRVQQFPQAAAILNEIIAKPAADAATTERAVRLQNDAKPSFQQAYDFALADAGTRRQRNDLQGVIKDLTDASQLFPDRSEPYIQLSELYASQNDLAGVEQALRRGAISSRIDIRTLLDQPEFSSLLGNQQFVGFLNSVFGPNAGSRPAELLRLDGALSQANMIASPAARVARLEELSRSYPGDPRINNALSNARSLAARVQQDQAIGLYGEGVGDIVLEDVRKLLSQQQAITSVSFYGDESFVANYGTNGYFWRGVPASLRNTLEQLKRDYPGDALNRLFLGPNGSWFLIFGTSGYRADSIPPRLQQALETVGRNGETITAAALGPSGSWVIIRNGTGWLAEGIPQDLGTAIQSCINSGEPVKQVTLTNGGGWLIIEGANGYRSRGVPNSLIERLRAINSSHGTIQAVAVTPSNGWMLIAK